MPRYKSDFWQARIEDARKFRREKVLENVKRHLRLYVGDHWGRASYFRRGDLITVNMIFPMVRNQVPHYYFRDPKIFVKPRNEESEIPAVLSEQIVNYYWKEIDAKKQMRFNLYDVLLFGYAVAEIGHRFETDVLKGKDGDRIAYHEYIKTDQPYIQRVSPARFLFDIRAEMDPIVNSEWVGKEFFRGIQDVKKDPKYQNTKDLEANLKQDDPQYGKYGEEVLKLIEIHDRKHNRLLVYADGYDKPLRDIEHPYSEILEGHNFCWLQFNHIPDEPYGLSQVALLEDQQHELNRTRTQMFHHRRRVSNRRYIYDEGSISDRAIQKLEEAEGGAMVAVSSIDRIKPLEDARLSFDVPLIESIIKQDLRELTGMPASQFGIIDNQSRSATEHIQIEAARAQRNNDNLILVEEFVRDCARKLLQVIQAKVDRKQAVKIVGPKGAFWQEWSKEDIQGEYYTEIDPGSTVPMSDELRKKQSLDLLAIFGKLPGFNMRELSEEVFKAFDMNRVSRFYLPNFDQFYGGAPPLAPQEGASVAGQTLQQNPPSAAGLAANARQSGPVRNQ